jgi:cellulose synthase operon protein C
MSVRLNARFAVVSVLVVAALLTGYFFLHARQVRRNAAGLLAYSERAAAEGKPDRAVRALNRYLLTYPEDRVARERYARLIIDTQKTAAGRAQAVPALERVLAADPDRDDVRAEIATLLYEAQSWAAARPYLEARAARPGATPQDVERLGRVYAALNDWAALDAFLTPLCTNGRGPSVFDYVRLAEARRRLGRDAAADAVMEKLAKDYETDHAAFLARAGYWERYEPKKAEKDLNRARELAPTVPEVALAVAARTAGRGEWEEARKALAVSLAAHPKDARLYRQRAAVEAAAGQPGEAVAVLRRGVEAAPGDAALTLALAQALADVREFAEARARLADARKLPPVGVKATDFELMAARLDVEAGDWPRAMAALESLRRRREADNDPTAPVDALLARCAALAGEPDRQLEFTRQAYRADDPVGRLQIAGALLDAGRIEEAITEYQALVNNPRAPVGAAITLARLLVLRLGATGARPQPDVLAQIDRLLTRVEAVVPDSWEVPVLRAEVLFAEDRAGEAKKLLATVRERRPTDFPLWGTEATILAREKRFDAADEVLDRAEKELGDSAALRLTRLRIHQGRGPDPSGLLAKTGQGAERFPPEDRVRLWRAQAEGYALIGRYADAATAAGRLVEARPNDLGFWLARLDLAERLGDAAGIERCLTNIRRIDGAGGPYASYVAAWRLLRSVDPKVPDRATLDEARRHLAETARQRPGWGKAALLRGDLERLAGEPDRAAEAYREAFDKGEHTPALMRSLVTYYTRRRHLGEIEKLIRRVLDTSIPDAGQNRTFAELYLQSPNYQAAYEMARRAVADDSKDPADFLWLAQISQAAGRPAAEVEAALRKAIALDRDRPDGWVGLVRYLVSTNRRAEADQVVADVSRTAAPDKALLILPYCYESVGDEVRAAAAYQAALAAHPKDLPLAQAAAAFYQRTRRTDRAEPLYRAIVTGSIRAGAADVAAARRDLALGLAAQGAARSREALDLLAENAKQPGADLGADSLARAVVLAHSRGTYGEAVRLLEAEFARRPLPAAPLFLLARLALATGRPAKAREAMTALLGVDPGNPEYLTFWIEALLRQGELSDARFWLARLAKARPGAADTVRLQALADFRSGAPERAIAAVRAFDAKSPADAGKLAPVLEEFNALDAAEKFFRQAAASNDPVAGLALACFLGRRGRYAEALDLCDRARSGLPADLVVTVAVEVLRGGDRPPDAAAVTRVEGWLKGAAVPPDRAWQPAWLAGELADVRQDFPAAIAAHRQALDLAPGQPIVAASLGRLLVLRPGATADDSASAARLLEKVAAGSPPNRDEIEGLLGLAALKSRRPELAVAKIKEADAALPSPRGAAYLAYALKATGDAAGAKAAWHLARARGLDRSQLHPLERALASEVWTAVGQGTPPLP